MTQPLRVTQVQQGMACFPFHCTVAPSGPGRTPETGALTALHSDRGGVKPGSQHDPWFFSK